MNRFIPALRMCLTLIAIVCSGPAYSRQSPVGIFDGRTDIGSPRKAGSAQYNPDTKAYTVAGGGVNMWFGSDAFQFVWKRASGNVSLSSAVRWTGAGGNAHKKACLLIRQDLEPDAPYADAVVHGNGLTSLQYREVRGGPTREIQSAVSGPRSIRIEKEGDEVFMSIAGEGESLHPAGGSFRIKLTDPFYAGLGVCAHDSDGLEEAVFSGVELTTGGKGKPGERVLESTLETVPI
ncbi:MAG TPA: hypothetical protein VK569_04035, partial [Bacteroidota bacterium]|nr:hypothetical protein [Bacteroidota bacterium]